jgi:hypothetical protein
MVMQFVMAGEKAYNILDSGFEASLLFLLQLCDYARKNIRMQSVMEYKYLNSKKRRME